ncbi:ubiquitin carboxyl-terminal hydrolase family protein [Striga asiatica]|uniref:Ubiquitin carboxyl-terminal hydrolase family protein n=1 Tax=Striga asiatica TaxID=4170 RepID=A0A5A7P1A7_STRAF|nr:ubiquitin carboxyl-terminal hydrolase family protein [Striga asiatica]
MAAPCSGRKRSNKRIGSDDSHPLLGKTQRASSSTHQSPNLYRSEPGPVPFIRFPVEENLCKLVVMGKDRVIGADKVAEVKREFGSPYDFLVNLVLSVDFVWGHAMGSYQPASQPEPKKHPHEPKTPRDMNRATILRVLPFLLLVLLHPKPTAQKKWPVSIPPLCDAQYGLVNSACRSLPACPWAPPGPQALGPSPLGPQAQNSTADEEKCCRWLREVDNACVCGLLVPLPAFLSRPAHNYTVVVEGVCEVTFRCGPRLVGP